MKTYIKHHFAAIITLLVLAATQAFAAETNILSNYTPNGESFSKETTIDFQKQTFKAVLDLSTCQTKAARQTKTCSLSATTCRMQKDGEALASMSFTCSTQAVRILCRLTASMEQPN